jgi:hypothetical protein
MGKMVKLPKLRLCGIIYIFRNLGGLGLKKIEEWTKASMMQHIWPLFARSVSIWVAWIKENLLKGRSFWKIGIPQNKELIKFEVIREGPDGLFDLL